MIAITKDLPDTEGDKANNIETFATRLGVRTVSLAGEAAAVDPCEQSVWFQGTARHMNLPQGSLESSLYVPSHDS